MTVLVIYILHNEIGTDDAIYISGYTDSNGQAHYGDWDGFIIKI